ALVGLHDQLHAGRVTHELVGAETDGVLLEPVGPYLLEILLGHDPARPGGQGAVVRHEVWKWLVEDETDAVGIDDDHVADLILEDLGARPLAAAKAELYVIGGGRDHAARA